MTVDKWIDIHTKMIHNRTVRLLDSETHRGIGDMMFAYMDREVKGIKITSKFIFIFI